MARKNPMKYFSGSAVSRLPLYKLIAGGMAALLCASLGIGAMAAGIAAPAQAAPAQPAGASAATDCFFTDPGRWRAPPGRYSKG